MWSLFFWFCEFSDKLRVHSLSLSGWLCNPSCTDGGLLCLSTTTRWQQNKQLYVCVLLSCLHHMSGSKAATWMEGFHFAPCSKWCEIRLCYKWYSNALHKTHRDVLWDTQRHSPSLLLTDGQCSIPPQGTSCSCGAAAWQTAGRSLDGSSSAGASGPAVQFLFFSVL